MTRRLVFRPQAASELLDARAWYESQRPGLGAAFAAAIDATVARLVDNPLAYARVRGETRRVLVQRFPYAIYFRLFEDDVVVLAVMHGRRFPGHWRSRR